MLGKSVLPRVLVRVTLLLPAHLPVLIGQRVSHSGGCRYVWMTVMCVKEGMYVLKGMLVMRARQTDTDHHHLLLDLNSLFKYK